jgi:SAM-dependent methyltransferase
MSTGEMGRFWDARAKEDAFYFVDNTGAYRDADIERFWAEGRRNLDAVLELVGAEVRPDDTVLDIGCGVGRLTRVLAERSRHVHAIDVSAEMLAQARELNAHLQNVTWHQGDGTTLRPIEDATVDAVVSHVVFQHIPDPQVTLGYVREIGRVLRPGGWAAFQISNDPSIHRPTAGARAKLKAAVGRAPKGQAEPQWLGSAVDLGDLRSAAADGGLDVAQVAGEGTQFCYVRAAKPGPPGYE